MRKYNVQLFVGAIKNAKGESEPTYMIALSPNLSGAQGTKTYTSKEVFITDLKKYLGYSDGALDRFFSDPNKHGSFQCELTDEVASYLGWVK